MAQNTLITDAKIEWLSKRGLVIKKTDNGAVSYFLTEEGKKYLSDTKAAV